ncbi:MAG: ribbon-helix-helix protein, CopG family [Dehalococcoidia bacterium]|nr:ribbon-helix-helix protein, CopG family [Dehalococcoidia bacterium]
MSGIETERLEVRLDRERRRKLSELAQGRGVPVSQAVRQMIDEAYKEALRERRIRAARELARLAVEDVPDPATLSRQLEGTYEPPDLLDAHTSSGDDRS